ncbi:MAG: FHA domain-containing protein [Acidobacteriota bacterium]
MPKTHEAPPPADATAALHIPTTDPAPRNGACLVVIQGREIGRDFRLRRRSYVLGRDPDLDIPIVDDAVSRRHAQIEVQPDPESHQPRYWLIDLQAVGFSDGIS